MIYSVELAIAVDTKFGLFYVAQVFSFGHGKEYLMIFLLPEYLLFPPRNEILNNLCKMWIEPVLF